MSIISHKSTTTLYWIAGLLSLLLSYDGCLRATVVNPDGICYLQSAATMASAGVRDAMHLCGQAQWPFYSMLIYGVVWLTHLSYLSAAFALNALFSLVSVLTFITIVKMLGGRDRVLWFAAATILCAHEFDSVREYVIRDHGFWAFYLVSVAALLHYFRVHTWSAAALWVSAVLVATLFRVEGILFLLLVPWIALFDKNYRVRALLQLHAANVFFAVVLLGFLVSHPDALNGNRLLEIQNQFLHGITQLSHQFHARADALGQHVLSVYSARDATLVLGLLLVAWYCVSVVTNLSLIYTLLVGYAGFKKVVRLDQAACLTLAVYIAINLLITIPFLVEYMFLTKRYLIALSLLLMCWVPFALEHLRQQVSAKWVMPAVSIAMLASAIGGVVDFGYSKAYLRDAGVWLATHASADAAIYSNDYQVMFYSNHFGNTIFTKAAQFADLSALANQQWQQYHYLALHINHNALASNAVVQDIQSHVQPMQVFANKRGDAVLIYQILH